MTTTEPPLQVVETTDNRDRIRAIARREGISQAQVVRDLIRAGLGERERQSEALTPVG